MGITNKGRTLYPSKEFKPAYCTNPPPMAINLSTITVTIFFFAPLYITNLGILIITPYIKEVGQPTMAINSRVE
tara:strand:+ start:4286 stop:4507 length:222 start_codon:yes stop_codon:yes gene_type:complete